jgi:hypothetical protein
VKRNNLIHSPVVANTYKVRKLEWLKIVTANAVKIVPAKIVSVESSKKLKPHYNYSEAFYSGGCLKSE